MAETTEEFAPLAESQRAVAALPDEDWLRLEKVARYHVYRYPAIEPQEVLGEAVARVLIGKRQWPRGVHFMTFLRNAIRSIADEFREAEKAKVYVPDPDNLVSKEGGDDTDVGIASLAASPAQQAEDREILNKVWALFADDEDVQALLYGTEEGLTGPEVQRQFDLTPEAYDAARKRLERKLKKHFPRGRKK